MNSLASFLELFALFANMIAELAEGFGPVGVLIFITIYVLVILAFLPITPFSMAAGAIYGWWGIPIAYASAVLGASLAFFISRSNGRSYIEAAISKRPLAKAIDRSVLKGGGRLVLLIRLSGVLPFAVQNYSFGLSALRFRDYLWPSLIGLIPDAVVKVWLGKSSMDILDNPRTSFDLGLIMLVVAIVVTLIMLAYVGRIALQELREAGFFDEAQSQTKIDTA